MKNKFLLTVFLLLYLPSVSTLFATIATIIRCPQPCVCDKAKVFCRHKNLSNIPKDIPTPTKKLDLSDNNFTRLQNYSFVNLIQLNALNLSQNKIKFLDINAFAGLKNLTHLNLSFNYLNAIPNRIFKDTPSLIYLYLRNNKLNKIPALAGLNFLAKLDLSTNKITDAIFPPSFQTLNALNTIKLDENKIKQISADDMKFLQSNQLLHFSCRACHLTDLTDSDVFKRFVSLKTVTLGENPLHFTQLQMLIESLSVARDLTELDLVGSINGYNLSPDFFKSFEGVKLRILDLSEAKQYGRIKKYTFQSLKWLTHLYFQFSQISTISKYAFKGLDSLEDLYLDFCGLSFQMYPRIGALFPDNLLKLSLQGNVILDIKAQAFHNLHRLQTLVLKECCVHKISERAFPLNNSLKTLNLALNRLHRIHLFNATTFKRLRKLSTLSLAYNDLNDIIIKDKGHKLLKYLSNLKILTLNGNRIKTLPESFFSSQAKLRALELTHNEIESWNNSLFRPLLKLSLLNLAHNKIQIISKQSIQYWPALKKLGLQGNPFNCGCELQWFLRWIQKTQIKINHLNETYCGLSKNFNGIKLLAVNLQELRQTCLPFASMSYIFAASAAILVTILLLIALIYRFQWYLKWYFYRFYRSLSNENKHLHVVNTRYYIFLSYYTDDELWADEFVATLEKNPFGLQNIRVQNLTQSLGSDISICSHSHFQQLSDSSYGSYQETSDIPSSSNEVQDDEAAERFEHSSDSDVTAHTLFENYGSVHETSTNKEDDEKDEKQYLLNKGRRKDYIGQKRHIQDRSVKYQSMDNYLVYYEKRCLPNKSRFEESARAIYSCKFVIVFLSTTYLRDRRLQFELDLIQSAMTERYGYDAFNHVIFVTAERTGELMHLIPQQLRSFINKTCIFWSASNAMQQNYFWEKVNEKLTKDNV